MKSLRIAELLQSPATDAEVVVKGWVRTKRGNKNVAFIALNDGSCVANMQVVVDLAKFDEELLRKVTTGACLRVDGRLVASCGAGQGVEVQAEKIEIYGTADPETYPLQKKGHSLEFLRDIAYLRPRTNTFGAIFRIRHAMAYAIHKYFNDKGFYYLHTPLITASDCEGAGAMFQVTTLDLNDVPRNAEGEVDYTKDFFGKSCNLTVSGQLEGELGAGQVEIAKRLYLDGPFADQPFVSVALDELTDRGWRHVLKSSESPLFQTGLTLCIEGWNAVGPQRLRELVSTMADTALATRCHVVLTANDMPGGGESDQAAFVTERFACAVSVAPAIAEQGAASTKVARYLEYLADAFGTAAPTLSAAATKTLDAYRWPRNYLQLREVSERLYILVGAGAVDRAVAEEVLAQEDVIKTATFGAPTLESDLYILRPLADTERDIAHLVVDHLHGNRTRAAEVLGISRTTLWRLLKDDDR